MAKKIIMLSPFDVLTGNLSGRQELVYGPNDTRAYEAANGRQGAKNYKPRFIGAKRADGTSYFSVRMKSTAVLNGKTRMAMGLTAITALIISACKKAQASASYSWAKIKKAYETDLENGTLPEGIDSVTKFANFYIRRMLQYKQERWFRQSASSPVELHNPYDLNSADALVIKQSAWLKFANLFAFSVTPIKSAYITIDGTLLFCAVDASDNLDFSGAKSFGSNITYKAVLGDVAIVDDNVTYKSLPVYTDNGDAVAPLTVMINGEKFTTIAPEP